MAHQRGYSISDPSKPAHSLSLKVLRLSRPSLAYEYPLPRTLPFEVEPTKPASEQFVLTPILELPATFGEAYVGETFSCTLCANNDYDGSDTGRIITGVRISADMQTPSSPLGIALDFKEEETAGVDGADLPLGNSVQKIVGFELKEEGTHVLAVTLIYTETQLAAEGKAASGRVRQFRKLYQFVAVPQLNVRTKAGEVRSGEGRTRFALEAQLENVGQNVICLEAVRVNPTPSFKATSFDWDTSGPAHGVPYPPIMNPRDVVQVAFLLEKQEGVVPPQELPVKLAPGDNRTVLGQLTMQWRTTGGDRGSLSTGWLTSRKR